MKKTDSREKLSDERREEIAAKLNRAGDILEQGGWCQGIYTDRQGRHCVVGAMYAAEKDRGSYLEIGEYRLFNEYLRRPRGIFRTSSDTTVTQWNDAKGQTAEEVINTLRKAAAWVKDAG